MSSLCVRFGAVVRQMREAHSLSQEQLAERADLNRSYIGEIERGSAMPSLATVLKLAGGLNVTPSSLLERYEQVASH